MQDIYRSHSSCRIFFFFLQFRAWDSAFRLFLILIAEWHGVATRFRQLPVSFCLVMSKSDTEDLNDLRREMLEPQEAPFGSPS